MAFEDYDVGKAFERIEAELIDSMMRNLGRHLKEEDAEGFDWSQWQAEQLKALDEYRRRNKKLFGPQFRQINKRIEQAIRHANASGQKDEELRILEALSKNKKIERKYANRKASIEAGGDAFFRVNDRKLNALVEATHHDMTKAEHAVLRRTNDQYRKIIFDAQVYANTGAGTVEKAIDMATKDFLSRGIDCIVYSNGARHSISDYADMCIRTAERRAYLAGEGVKRQEWGIATVIVGKRGTMSGGDHGTACPHCIPWLGKVLIDDVWSGGEAWINGEDRQRSKGAEAEPMGTSPITGAKYPLMSAAIAAGLYHPRCKDGHTTYFEELEDLDDDLPKPATKEDVQEAVEAEKEETRGNYIDRQVEKYGRLAEYSFDSDNKRKYETKVEKWLKEKKSRINGIIEAIRKKAGSPIKERWDVWLHGSDISDLGGFQKGLENADPLVKDIFRNQFTKVDYILGCLKSRCINGEPPIICLDKKYTPDTIAHELFHSLDKGGSISKKFSSSLLIDWIVLQTKAKAYGGISKYLEKEFPDAFKNDILSPERKVKIEYRGISDIIHGMSGASIDLGFGHDKKYWLKPGRLEAEAWAQFGRIYYSNVPEVRRMLSVLFPSFEKEAIKALKGL